MSNCDFIAIDFETAAFDRASACEMGLTFVRNNEVASTTSYLIKPPHNYYEPSNIAIHGITPELTELSPDFGLFWPSVADALRGETIVAHYAPFDMSVIRRECERCELPLPEFRFVCSRAISRYIIPNFWSYGLKALCLHFKIDSSGYHRAGADSRMTAQLLLRLCQESDANSLEDLMEKHCFRYGVFEKQEYKPFGRLDHESRKKHFLEDYHGDPSTFDEENPFFDKEVVFTGKMYQVRQDMMRMVLDIGGRTKDSVTKSTNFLVVGQQDFRVVGEDGMSAKQKKAIKMIEEGAPLTILSESEFLMMINN